MAMREKLRKCSLVASYAVYMVCCFVPIWALHLCRGIRRGPVRYEDVAGSSEDADIAAAMEVDIDAESDCSSSSDECEAETDHSEDAVA
jgi:hypothetical protein